MPLLKEARRRLREALGKSKEKPHSAMEVGSALDKRRQLLEEQYYQTDPDRDKKKRDRRL